MRAIRFPEGRAALVGALASLAAFGGAVDAYVIQGRIPSPLLAATREEAVAFIVSPILLVLAFPALLAFAVTTAGGRSGWAPCNPRHVAAGAFFGALLGMHSTAAGFGWLPYWSMAAIGTFAGFVASHADRSARTLTIGEVLVYLAILDALAFPAILLVPHLDFYIALVLFYLVVVAALAVRMLPRKAFGGA